MGRLYDTFNKMDPVQKQRFLSGLEIRIMHDHYALKEEHVADFVGLYKEILIAKGLVRQKSRSAGDGVPKDEKALGVRRAIDRDLKRVGNPRPLTRTLR